jgi:phage shock protein PspC (stress-responsive transcriptional regulator)
MVRTLLGYAVLAVVGLFALRLLFGLLGLAFKLLSALLWLAALGFILYLILKVISPRTARRVRDMIRGGSDVG